ncbi:MAG: DUF262 domain-containing protein [Microthrixaceae bacterium]|nr:DUF262 domain-containing protein [Microthrixaceae bacterium]
MSKAEFKVRELVDMIERGELQLPEMQRRYVWTQTKVRDLLDSLYRGYPSGIILAWKAPHGAEVETRAFAVDANPDAEASLLLLDGQQRLTSLSAVLRGEKVKVRGRKTPVEILFNLEHPDELTFITEVNEDVESDDDSDDSDEADLDPMEKVNKRAFVVASNPVLALPNWVRVTDVFNRTDAEIFQGAGVSGFDDPRYTKYSERLKQLRGIADYMYRAEVLEREKSYEEVTEIFVRVNSLGAKLRGSDLALAQITARWKGSLEMFNEYQQAVAERGFDYEVGGLKRSTLEEGWRRTKRCLDFAVDFVQANLQIDSPTLLSSPLLLITTAYWAHKRDLHIAPEEATQFRTWFLVANAKGRYSRGSSESILDQDLAVLRGGGTAEDLADRLVQQVGRMDFVPGDLAGRTSTAGVFKAMFLLFKACEAKDWATSLLLSPKHANRADKIEFHHIYPKAYLKAERPELSDREINDIANLAFIGSTTNKQISAKTPSVYRQSYPPDAFEAQLIDFDEWGEEATDYESFLAARRVAIADALNEFHGVAATAS